MNVAYFLAGLRKIEDKNRILACSPCIFNYYVNDVFISKNYVILRTSCYPDNACTLRSLAVRLLNLGVEQYPVLINALCRIYDIIEIDSICKLVMLKTSQLN